MLYIIKQEKTKSPCLHHVLTCQGIRPIFPIAKPNSKMNPLDKSNNLQLHRASAFLPYCRFMNNISFESNTINCMFIWLKNILISIYIVCSTKC
ncbi:hypothetical protein Hanom_Chr05g00403261 [Helianthus anomalus]